MNSVVNIKDFLVEKRFRDDVIHFFQDIKTIYYKFRENNEAVFVLKAKSHLFIFLRYIAEGTHTELPTLSDRFFDVKSRPRVSEGEWVVQNIYEIAPEIAQCLLGEVKNHRADPVSFLKSRVLKPRSEFPVKNA